VRDPVSGQVVLLNPRTGETIVIDPETRRARVVQVQVEARLLSVRLSPASVILKVDEFRQLSASANYSDRTSRDVSGNVTWTSSNPRIASVDRTGRITGRAAGFAEITATYDGTASEVLQVEVIQLPLVGLALDPAELSVEPGATAQINAQAIYTDGSVADFTESVRWSTSDPLVATVSRGGEVTGVAPGTASISGEFQGVSTFPATVRVGDLDVQGLVVDAQASSLAVGDTFRATVTAVLPGGATRDVSAQARWQVGDALILRERDGVVTAVGSGETTVVATWGRGRSEPVTVRVQSQAPLGIVLSPAVPILLEGATASLRATAVYTDGTAQALTEGAEWRSSDPNVLGVGPDGTLTARRAGRAQITALRGNLSSQPMEVLVASAQTSRFEVSSTREALAPGASAQIDAYVRLQDGVQFDITSLASWTSTDPSVATVDGGRVVAVAPGTARLNARWSGLVAPAVVVEVAAPTPLAVTIDPLVERTVVGATMRLSATGVFMDGSTAGVTDAATWTSGNTAVLEVVAPGQVRALRPGTAGVDVSLGGVSAGTLVVRVMESPVQSLALAPANVNTGGLRPLVLTATLADGSTLDLTHAAAWTVTDPRVATVSEAGVAFGVSAGTTTVRGTFGTYTAEATVTVTR
jgi:uncharacterized protein YjdB